MKMQFKQAVRIGRQTFPLGIHEVPAEIEKHPHYAGFKASGYIVMPSADPSKKILPAPTSPAAKQSAAVAKSQVDPDAEIGGDEEIPVSPKKKGK